MVHNIVYLLIGILAGVSIGIIGIGGGTIIIPLLVMIGLDIRTAVGCSLVMFLLPNSIGGIILYNKKKYIDWLISLLVVTGSFLGIIIGSYITTENYISKKNTYKILTIMLIIITGKFIKDYLLN